MSDLLSGDVLTSSVAQKLSRLRLTATWAACHPKYFSNPVFESLDRAKGAKSRQKSDFPTTLLTSNIQFPSAKDFGTWPLLMEHEISHKNKIRDICGPLIEKIKKGGYESAKLLIGETKKTYEKSDTDTKHDLLTLINYLVLEGGTDFHRALLQSEFLDTLSNARVKKTIKLILEYLENWKSTVNPDYKNAFDETTELLRDIYTGISFGLTQSSGPGSMGQFQICPVNPLIPFYTMLYFRAQRLLSLGRSSSIFHMLNIHISRQAMHLVILLNDLAYTGDGLNSEQMDERVDLEDEFIELESEMRVWGFEGEGEVKSDHMDVHISEIQKWYGQLFKERFYFVAARNPSTDKIFKKLLFYDRKTFSFREAPVILEDPLNNLTNLSIGEGSSKLAEVNIPNDYYCGRLIAQGELKRKLASMGPERAVPWSFDYLNPISVPTVRRTRQRAHETAALSDDYIPVTETMHSDRMTTYSVNTSSIPHPFGLGVHYNPIHPSREEMYTRYGVSGANQGSGRGMFSTGSPNVYEPARYPVPDVDPMVAESGSSGSFRAEYSNTSSNEQDLQVTGIYQCPHCPAQFDRTGRYEAHLNGHRDFRPYVCDRSCGAADCSMSFTSPEALGSHKKKDRVKCENCGNLVAKKNLARHNKSHCPSLF